MQQGLNDPSHDFIADNNEPYTAKFGSGGIQVAGYNHGGAVTGGDRVAAVESPSVPPGAHGRDNDFSSLSKLIHRA
jgi:hypothetical protein